MMNVAVRIAVVLNLLFINELQSAYYECGNQSYADKVLNGEETAIDEYPWTALIRYKKRNSNRAHWGCGGSLVGTKTVLTAAHCVEDMALASLGDIQFVRLGEYDHSTEMDCVTIGHYKDCADDPMDIKVKNVIIHPERNTMTKMHDIAILTLETTPPYTDFIRPVCLPDELPDDPKQTKSNLYVAGWGWTIGAVPSASTVKMDAALNSVNDSTCLKHFPNFNELFQLCAGGEDGRNACKGDSGGPLMYSLNNKWKLTGIVSYGPRQCGFVGIDGLPTVFTKVESYLPWIRSVLMDQDTPSTEVV